MKVLISNNPRETKDVYENKRLRKNLKGACELADIPFVTVPEEDYDILHILDLNQDLIVKDAVDRNVPFVVSALMSESDPQGRFTSTDKKKGTHLTLKAARILNQANLVFVPNLACEKFLINEGITSEIKVLPSGVNLKRFVAINDIELNLFRKYFGLSLGNKIILCVSQYDDKEQTATIIEIAKRLPEYTFVFLGQSKRSSGIFTRFIDNLLKKSPKNLIFSEIIEDDVYRSGMMNASVYLSLKDLKFDSVTTIEAMASKTRVISYSKDAEPTEFDNYIVRAKNIDEVVKDIKKECTRRSQKELSSALEFAKNYTLDEVGKVLKNEYKLLLE